MNGARNNPLALAAVPAVSTVLPRPAVATPAAAVPAAVTVAASAPPWAAGLRGELRRGEPMARHSSWRAGGAAEHFYTPADRADLLQLLAQLPADTPLHYLGLGSNLLVRDGGVGGVVIRTVKGLTELRVDGGKLTAEAGVTCAKVARAAVAAGLAGAEFLAGVPGSFGGALAMNAGAFGGETWKLVESVECLGRDGKCKTFAAGEIDYGYRRVDLPAEHCFLAGTLQLQAAAADAAGRAGKERIRDLLHRRAATQPVQSANAGSVFRNPPGDYAARLIEAAGLKGAAAGDAVISCTHANFIINRGGATAAEIERLITRAQNEVRRQCGVNLQTEVRIIGRAK